MILRASALLALPFILCSFFYFSKPTHWQFQTTKIQGSTASILQYEPLCQKDAIGVEFLKIGEKRQASLCLLQNKIDEQFHGTLITIHLIIEGFTYEGSAYCLQGGQKLVLSASTEEKLIELLGLSQCVTLRVHENSATLMSENFNKYRRHFSF